MIPTSHPSAARHLADPELARLAVTIINPARKGIFCVGGKTDLPVGATIWADDPDQDAGWRVLFFENRNVPVRELDHSDWEPTPNILSTQGVVRVNITAKVYGIQYSCARFVTVI